MSTGCYLCGAIEGIVEAKPQSWLCGECLPIAEHVVAMSNGPEGSIAECRCGWRSVVAWGLRGTVQDAKVRMHWRDVIRRARDAADPSGGSLLDHANAMLGAAVVFVGLLNLVAFAAVLGRVS